MDKRVGFIGIIIEHREKSAEKVNRIISEYGNSIIARQGVPYEKRGCSVITLVVDMTTDEIGSFSGKLGTIDGVSIKAALAKKIGVETLRCNVSTKKGMV